MRLEKLIPRTPLEVWGVVTDWVIAEYWLGVETLRPLHADENPKAGMKLTYRIRGKEHPMTITAWQPEKRLTLESFQGGITATYAYSFRRVDGGTQVELDATCSAEGGFWKFILPLARFMMERADRKQLDALRTLVEATTGGVQRKPEAS
jgi:hypothetical protein